MATLNPECQQGKHRNCNGCGWDEDIDEVADCPCLCHRPDAVDPALVTRLHNDPDYQRALAKARGVVARARGQEVP